MWKEKERHSLCETSWGLLGGQSALVYSVQLNKLKCQEHNASSILREKNPSFLSLWRCWTAHSSCGYFSACGNIEKCTPLWPPSLWNKNKINTLRGRDFCKTGYALSSRFKKSLSKAKDRHGWVQKGMLFVRRHHWHRLALHLYSSLTGMHLWAFISNKPVIITLVPAHTLLWITLPRIYKPFFVSIFELQNSWNSNQVCWLTNLFWHSFSCTPASRWFMSVGRTSEADRVGYSPFSKPLAVEGYLLQQMPERGRCFSSSMRQIPRLGFILYLYSYLFIPAQLGASQRNAYTMGPTRVTMCICAVEATLLWEGEGLDKGMVSIIHNLSKRPSTQGNIVYNFVGKQEKKNPIKNM